MESDEKCPLTSTEDKENWHLSMRQTDASQSVVIRCTIDAKGDVTVEGV